MLTITHLGKTYPGNIRALHNVSLNIPTGVFGLLGPNGAGKSTLMRIVATLQIADSGQMTLDGVDVLREHRAIRRSLGYLPQDFGVPPKISAIDMLAHIAILKGITNGSDRQALIETALLQVNLWSERKRALHTFSGGMRQRFGVAQAILGNPRLIVVDEPTSGLDPDERNRLLNVFAQLAERAVVIYSTHLVQDVADLCQKVAILASGVIVYSGSPAEAIAGIRDRVWQAPANTHDIHHYRNKMQVLSSRLHAGVTHIRVLADHCPDQHFNAVPASLADAYFARLHSGNAE